LPPSLSPIPYCNFAFTLSIPNYLLFCSLYTCSFSVFCFCVFAYWKTSWQFANECNEKRHFPTPSADLHYFRPFNKTFIASLSPSLSNFPLFAIKKQLLSTENCCFIYQEKKGLHSLKTAFLPKLWRDEIGWKQK
jgi:hypothetical protein